MPKRANGHTAKLYDSHANANARPFTNPCSHAEPIPNANARPCSSAQPRAVSVALPSAHPHAAPAIGHWA